MKRLLMLSLVLICMQLPALAQEETPEKPAEPAAAETEGVKLNEEIEALVKQLGADTWKEREDAMKRLIEIGRPALAAVAKAAESEDLEVKNRASKILETLNFISPADCAKVDGLVKKYQKAVTAKIPDAIEELIKKLEDEDEKERNEAAENLLKIGRPALSYLDKLKASENAQLKELAEKISAEILENIEKFETEILEEIRKIKFSGAYLVGKLAPDSAEEALQKTVAQVLSGVFKLSYWNGPDNVMVRGNKLVVGGREMPLPAGPWSIQEKGDKVFINGQEYNLPAVIEENATPGNVLGRIVARGESGSGLKKTALDIIEKRKEKDAAGYLVRALSRTDGLDEKEARELKFQILGVLSKIVEDGPGCPAADCSEDELGKSVKEWKRWLGKSQRNNRARR